MTEVQALIMRSFFGAALNVIETLLPLSRSTITQPVGSVLGTNPISKTYLLSSAIFCILDALILLLEVLRHRLFYHLSFRAATRTVVECRYRDVADDTEGFRTLRSCIVMRWVLFILGTHGRIMKLAGGSGIPWFQCWGYSYVNAFVVFDAMILFMPKMEVDTEAQIRLEYRGGAFSLPTDDWPELAGFPTAFISTTYLLAYLSSPFAQIGISSLFMIPGITAFIIAGKKVIVLSFRRLAVGHPSFGEKILILNKANAELIRMKKVLYDESREEFTSC